MIFGHLGLAFLFKAKFYNRSLLALVIFCYLPDLIYYILFGTQYILVMDYPPINFGVIRWLISITGSDITLIKNPVPLSHSVILYTIFIVVFVVLLIPRGHVKRVLFYGAIILVHLLFDFLLPDANMKVPLVYLFYPFDPSIANFLPYLYWDALVFWFLDFLIFIAGFFVLLWAFSKNVGRELEDE